MNQLDILFSRKETDSPFSFTTKTIVMAYESNSAKPESQRTVVSNIHRSRTPPVEAGAHIVSIVSIMLERKTSGVDLKL